jgi:hypothetical protein
LFRLLWIELPSATGVSKQAQQEVAVTANLRRAAIRKVENHRVLDVSGFQSPNALFNSHGSSLLPSLRGAFRRALQLADSCFHVFDLDRLEEWFMMHSAARTRTEAGVP